LAGAGGVGTGLALRGARGVAAHSIDAERRCALRPREARFAVLLLASARRVAAFGPGAAVGIGGARDLPARASTPGDVARLAGAAHGRVAAYAVDAIPRRARGAVGARLAALGVDPRFGEHAVTHVEAAEKDRPLVCGVVGERRGEAPGRRR